MSATFSAEPNFTRIAVPVHRVSCDRGVALCDQTVTLNGFYASKEYGEHLRRIRFKAPDTGDR
jgi:hypothetical protein